MRRVPSILCRTAPLLVWPLAASTGDIQAMGATPTAAAGLRAHGIGGDADNLAIGERSEGLGASQRSARMVQLLYGSAAELTATGRQLWSQASRGGAAISALLGCFGQTLPASDPSGAGSSRRTSLDEFAVLETFRLLVGGG